MGDDERRQVVLANRATEHSMIHTWDPAEPIRVLTRLTGDDVLAAAEKQDRLGIGIEKVDAPRGA